MQSKHDAIVSLNPEVEDYFFILDPQPGLLDYQRAYGDAIAAAYEDQKIIYVPNLHISADLDFLNRLSFPVGLKKASYQDGLGSSIYVRNGSRFAVNDANPLVHLFDDVRLAVYVNHQIQSVFSQLRHAIRVLLPRYRTMREIAVTWRFTPTRDEPTHYDQYDEGTDLYTHDHRVKIFLNLDFEPRLWRTTHRLAELLRKYRQEFPDEIPAHLNDLAKVVNKWSGLQDVPAHTISFPTNSAIIANAEVIGHKVVSGNRMVTGEFLVDQSDMLDVSKAVHENYFPNISDPFCRSSNIENHAEKGR
jgi:hypothetical protein